MLIKHCIRDWAALGSPFKALLYRMLGHPCACQLVAEADMLLQLLLPQSVVVCYVLASEYGADW